MRFLLIKIKNTFKIVFSIILLLLLISNPNEAKESAKNGLLLAGNVIIPTLFPFLVCTMIIYKNRILDIIPFPQKIRRLKDNFIIFLLSNLGGYPIGAKLISEKFANKNISKKDAELLLLCSVNSGPAFSILAVGGGILGSYKLGALLYISQFISSILIFLFVSKKFSREISDLNHKRTSFIDIFVSSVTDSSAAMLNICGYIVICSTFLGVLKNTNLYSNLKLLVNLTLEISNAIISTKNVYILSLILGFASFSIIFQVLSICKSFSPSFIKILLSRILHAALSGIFTYIFLKIFPIARETIGNTSGNIILGGNSAIFSSLLLLTVTALIYSVSSKRYCGKISADIF